MDILGSVIGGVASLASGLFGNKAAEDSAAQANATNEKINERNLQFAANATKIRADDMRRAGINPLLAANPGAAAQAPQSIGAQKADVGSVVSSAAGVGSMFTQAQQKDIAKERLALDTANSSLNVAKVAQEIENLKETAKATAAGADLARSQALSQETNRQLMTAQTGVQSAVAAGKNIENAESQARLDWIYNQGRLPWQLGVDIKNMGGGSAAQFGGAINSLLQKIVSGPAGSSAASPKAEEIQRDIDSGRRDVKLNVPGLFRVTKEK